MYILTDQYDAGRIYKVVNPDECPLSGGAVALMCDEIQESPLGNACVCGLSVVVSSAKKFQEIGNMFNQAYKILKFDGTRNTRYLSEFLITMTMTNGSTSKHRL